MTPVKRRAGRLRFDSNTTGRNSKTKTQKDKTCR